MALAELEQHACDLEPKACVTHTSQTELIRIIQALRSDEPCFSVGKSCNCAEICEWHQHCRKLGTVWLR